MLLWTSPFNPSQSQLLTELQVNRGLQGRRSIGDAETTRKDWPEAIAEVMECHYDVRAGRALAFGLSSDKHYRIAYSYRVGDALYNGECFLDIARPQGSLFSIHYDPALPHLSHSNNNTRTLPILLLGAAGAVALSLALLLGWGGC